MFIRVASVKLKNFLSASKFDSERQIFLLTGYASHKVVHSCCGNRQKGKGTNKHNSGLTRSLQRVRQACGVTFDVGNCSDSSKLY